MGVVHATVITMLSGDGLWRGERAGSCLVSWLSRFG
jgi:hypothetical protein